MHKSILRDLVVVAVDSLE